jgi:hypothetical protein
MQFPHSGDSQPLESRILRIEDDDRRSGLMLRRNYRWLLTLSTLTALLLAAGAGDKWKPF